MITFLNGKFVADERAVVSVFDRGFLYGDGLFETIRIANGRLFRWREHWKRLKGGAEFLKIRLPFGREELRRLAGQVVAKNKMPEAILRLTLSRGVGTRGYSPRKADRPTLAITLHPAPKSGVEKPVRWKLMVSSVRLSVDDPLARFKTSNKLPQILARAEADAAGADEALLLNTRGFVAEGAGSNLFWVERGTVCTPPLTAGILPGVTRAVVGELCRRLEIPIIEKNIRLKELSHTDGVFLTLTSLGIVAGESLDGKELKQSPLVIRLAERYNRLFF